MINHVSDKKTLYILVGFTAEQLEKENNKLFDFPLHGFLNQHYEVGSREKRQMARDIRDYDLPYGWVMPEEFYVYGEVIQYDFDHIEIIKNNIYPDIYSHNHALEDIHDFYHKNFSDSNYKSNLFDEFVNNIYGMIIEHQHQYYVIYNDFLDEIEDAVLTNLYEKRQSIETIDDIEAVHSKQVIDISSNRSKVIDLIEKLTHTLDSYYVMFANLDEYNRMQDYLETLNHQFDGRIKVLISSAQKRIITRENDYRKIMNQYWGYNEFKELPFYKNTTASREIVRISQAQIIDDIVTQAEKGLAGELPRDIFITASTGAGKSLMFQIPALYLAENHKDQKPITIVISPLIGLMNDQTESLKRKNIKNAKTINSGISPLQKEKIKAEIKDGKIDLLYISSETLLSRGDIGNLIGERPIGLFIVDEAHIVTTWGKSFRPDYWYMGSHVSKLRANQTFPIVTFTATAIVEGKNSMLDEIKSTLNLTSVIKYVGSVKKDNLLLQISDIEKEDKSKYKNDAMKIKTELTLKTIKDAISKNEKLLIYFPTIKQIHSFLKYVDTNAERTKDKITIYYGRLTPHEKEQNFNDFLNGTKPVILATKAFGMGIDVPDIKRVYHYGMTGNVLDFVQEIGRAARDTSIIGHAKVDYLQKDFNEVKKMYAMSSIKKSELLAVMDKLIKIYKANRYKRNLVINPKEFAHIFAKGETESSNDDPENKVKLALLNIENDFNNKIKYPPIVTRPGEVNGVDYILVNDDLAAMIAMKKYEPFFEFVSHTNGDFYKQVYKFKTGDYWKKNYADHYSYPQFKFYMAIGDEVLQHDKLLKKLPIAYNITVKEEDGIDLKREALDILEQCEEAFRTFAVKGNHFDEKQLAYQLRTTLKYKFNEQFSMLLINSLLKANDVNRLNGITVLAEDKYKISNTYNDIFDKLKYYVNTLFDKEISVETPPNEHSYFVFRSKQDEISNYTIILGLLEGLGIASYHLSSGETPTLSLRINSVYPLENAVAKPKKYQNDILNQQYTAHKIGMSMLKYLFTKEFDEQDVMKKQVVHTKWFWEQIENYFFGIIPDEVRNEVFVKKEQ
ncbi:ATP-dependent DNA helicase RecQ [Macrococcus equipercicus]|uniref:DNA 3'-5' helicase n=1 Tax=Macrococcus equipercicus TaxID=69967 RepID=A0ABQ6R6G8_9STAP|nr:helicase-related protein [Macrococcus equipercicus]KAA1036892.1 ATP-dependent DNA helicase RecQ [Macrococcus equipercicus]